MIPIIRLLRPQQWIKNLFILIPLFFAGNFFDLNELYVCFLGIGSFSLIASAIYVLNDFKDIKVDRLHPKKKFRPLATGKVSKPQAIVLILLLVITGGGIALSLDLAFSYVLGTYLLLNIGYSFGLKQIPIADMFIVAFGFVLRTLAGGVLTDIAISKWLLIMIFLLALFLAIAKRRDDILVFLNSGISVRRSISAYNLQFIDSALTMISGIIIIAYLMYTISDEAIDRMNFEHLYVTSIFVVSGVLRYLQITLVEKNSSSPVRILYTDKFIQITMILWMISFFVILYIHK